MPRKQQTCNLTATQPNCSSRSRTSQHEKPFTYQSSLEQFLRPVGASQAKKTNQFTTPENKRKNQIADSASITYPSKKRKLSSRPLRTTKDCGIAAGTDASTPIIVMDDLDDELWDGDTLLNSASTTRTLCGDLERASFGAKYKSILKELDHPNHTPLTTPVKDQSPAPKLSTRRTFSPLEDISVVIPSSQSHERLSPLAIPFGDEKCRIVDSSLPAPIIADEIIPSSQSQHLLPYVISPQRARKFIGKPPSPPKDIIPCSQESGGPDLVLLARSRGFNIVPKGSFHEYPSTSEQIEDGSNVRGVELDKLAPTYQWNSVSERQFEDPASKIQPDAASIWSSTPPTTMQNEEHSERGDMSVSDDLEFSRCENSESPLPSSLPSCRGFGNDSQYTFVEETCPSEIREFLEDLEKRTDIGSSQPGIPDFQSEGDDEIEIPNVKAQGSPSSDRSSLPITPQSSQFSIGSSSQYTFVQASLPSDIAEFLNRLEEPMDC